MSKTFESIVEHHCVLVIPNTVEFSLCDRKYPIADAQLRVSGEK